MVLCKYARTAQEYDRQTGTTQLISVSLDGGPSTDYSSGPWIGGVGDKIAFLSPGVDLVAGDDSYHRDAFLWTRPL